MLLYFLDCGGVLTSGLGEISSPNFPNYYNDSDACAWLIMQPEGYRVNVSYTINTIKKGQSRETGNMGYTSQRKTKQKHIAICVGHQIWHNFKFFRI